MLDHGTNRTRRRLKKLWRGVRYKDSSERAVMLALTPLGKTGRRMIGRTLMLDVASRFSPVIMSRQLGLTFLIRTKHDSVSQQIFIEGSFDLDLMETVIRAISERIGQDPVRGRVFVDVGANIGTTSIPAVTRFGAGQVLSIEPEESNFRLLRSNIILNGTDSVSRCVCAAVSSSEGSAVLELSPENSGDHRIRTSAVVGDLGEERRSTAAIETRRLDSLLQQEGIPVLDVGLVWIDAQGHEGQVLESAPSLLGSGCPVVVEYWPYGLQRSGGLELFHNIVERHFCGALDIRSDPNFLIDIRDLRKLQDKYPTVHDFTDLALIPR